VRHQRRTYAPARSVASEYKRRVRWYVGGFHASLMPDEVAHAESVVISEAESPGRASSTCASGRLKNLCHRGDRLLPE
jgi:hypothetical protein